MKFNSLPFACRTFFYTTPIEYGFIRTGTPNPAPLKFNLSHNLTSLCTPPSFRFPLSHTPFPPLWFAGGEDNNV